METTPPTASLTSVVPLGKPASGATLQRPFPVFEEPCGSMCAAWENTLLTSWLRTEQDPHAEPPPPPETPPQSATAQYPAPENHSARRGPDQPPAPGPAGSWLGRSSSLSWRSRGTWPVDVEAQSGCAAGQSQTDLPQSREWGREHGKGRGTKRNTGCVPPRTCLIPQTPETNVLRWRADGARVLTPRALAQQNRVLRRLPLR